MLQSTFEDMDTLIVQVDKALQGKQSMDLLMKENEDR